MHLRTSNPIFKTICFECTWLLTFRTKIIELFINLKTQFPDAMPIRGSCHMESRKRPDILKFIFKDMTHQRLLDTVVLTIHTE